MDEGMALKRLLRLFRDLVILIYMNMLAAFLICKLTDSYSARSYGNLMMLVGALYMIIGFGSTGLVNFNQEYLESSGPKGKWIYATGRIKGYDRNFAYMLRWAISGGIPILIGSLIRG